MSRECSNPNCEERLWFGQRWIQILDQETKGVGDQPSAGTILTNFAAVVRSYRCAIAVLTPQLEPEARRNEERRSMFSFLREEKVEAPAPSA